MGLDLFDTGVVLVTLSRRNVLTFLGGLEGRGEKTIFQRGAFRHGRLLEDVILTVRAEPDELHYADRCPPGEMSSDTEAFITSYVPEEDASAEHDESKEL